jgi:hypothetical protein
VDLSGALQRDVVATELDDVAVSTHQEVAEFVDVGPALSARHDSIEDRADVVGHGLLPPQADVGDLEQGW